MYKYNKFVNFDRNRFARDFKRVHHNYERSVVSLFRKALKLQVAPVIAYIREHGVEHLSAHIDHLVQKGPMQEAYKKCYIKVGVQHAEWTTKWINKIAGKKSINFLSAVWQKLMSHFYLTDSSSRVTNVTDTTKERIREALAEAQALNLSKSETATYLEDKLKSDEFTRTRSLMIARTESTTAANKGAMLAADASDYLVGKLWIPILDMNTRPSHAEMNDQPPIALDETFIVGGYAMAYPGDPSGPAKEVIQCRCSLAIIPLTGANGLPMLKVA